MACETLLGYLKYKLLLFALQLYGFKWPMFIIYK